jgi:hypothetical protein
MRGKGPSILRYETRDCKHPIVAFKKNSTALFHKIAGIRSRLWREVENRDPFRLRYFVTQPAKQKMDGGAQAPCSVDQADNLFILLSGGV